MPTLTSELNNQVIATGVRFRDSLITISLNDHREISISLNSAKWLKWLSDATKEQRENWSIEPGGYAIYWEDLDDGIEVRDLLDSRPIS